MFQDIILAYKNDKTHFCGSIVYAPLKEEKNIHYYVLIDGQQRLTTIYILVKALLDSAETDNVKEALTETLFNKDKFDIYDVDTASKLKLKPIKSDNAQLSLLMENKIDEIDKASGIWRNYELFMSLIKEQLDTGLYVKDIYKGVEKLICAQIRLEDDDNAREIFERINSTGVPLSLGDKIRNFVLMTDADQDKLYEDYWVKIEKLIKRDKMTDFFIDYLNFKIDGFAKEKEAYDVFKVLYSDKAYTNESMLKELLHYAKLYNVFLYGNKQYGERVNVALSSLQRLKQTTAFLFLFSVFDDYEAQNITLSEVEKVLEFLLNYGIRRIMCEVASNSLRGLYKTLYSRVFYCDENKQHYYDSIVCFFTHLTSKDALIGDSAFSLALRRNNLYRKNALCKYLLTSIENQGKEQLITENLTIEHIMPQNKNLSTEWQKMLGDEWQEVRDKFLHTLGNLTLTGYNSELGDKPFKEKKELLDEAKTKVVTLYLDVKSRDTWNQEAIESRAKRLADMIVKMFPIVPPEYEISFNDPNYKEYTCENPEDATYKTPNYYVLLGERVASTNFASMLRSLIETLYELDSSIIENMADNDEQILTWSQNIMFSYNSEKTTGGNQKIRNTDIYESAGFSASHIMYIIQALLDKYDIDRSDFAYSARSNKK